MLVKGTTIVFIGKPQSYYKIIRFKSEPLAVCAAFMFRAQRDVLSLSYSVCCDAMMKKVAERSAPFT